MNPSSDNDCQCLTYWNFLWEILETQEVKEWTFYTTKYLTNIYNLLNYIHVTHLFTDRLR